MGRRGNVLLKRTSPFPRRPILRLPPEIRMSQNLVYTSIHTFNPTQAQAVRVNQGKITIRINGELTQGAAISYRVTSQEIGAVIAKVGVVADVTQRLPISLSTCPSSTIHHLPSTHPNRRLSIYGSS